MTYPPNKTAEELGLKTPHKELCDSALKHYEDISSETCNWNGMIPAAIEFYKENFVEPSPLRETITPETLQKGDEIQKKGEINNTILERVGDLIALSTSKSTEHDAWYHIEEIKENIELLNWQIIQPEQEGKPKEIALEEALELLKKEYGEDVTITLKGERV